MKLFFINIILFSIIAYSKAQSISPSIINTNGNSVQINNEIYQWSVGEPYIQVDIASNIIVSSGFLQPEQEFITKIDNNIKPNELSLYPNPLKDILSVNTNFGNSGILSYHVFQIDGKLLHSQAKDITLKESFNINLQDLSVGNYIIEFIFERQDNIKSSSSYKILKKN
jgi:hypothetical protein